MYAGVFLIVGLAGALIVAWRGGPVWLIGAIAGLGAAANNLARGEWTLAMFSKAGSEALMIGAAAALIALWWQRSQWSRG